MVSMTVEVNGTDAKKPLYHNGDEVYVFYRMDKRCERHRKYLAVLDPRHGGYRPRAGMAEGWVPARVTLDHDLEKRAGEVCVEYRWSHFYDKQGRACSSSTGWTEWYPLRHVCKAPETPGLTTSLVLRDVQPDLAIIAFRWGGRDQVSHCSQWGETGTSSSDTFFAAFLDQSVHPTLGTNYEVWIVYIEDHSDMVKIADTAHLIFGASHPLRRAKKYCSMFFLYPTAFEESCVPTEQTGGDNGAGLVDQKSLFRMMKSVERAGIPTQFPHCSGLYQQLASKSWTSALSLVPHLRVPPTVSLPRHLIEESCARAAGLAFDSLLEVKRQQAMLRGEGKADDTITIEKGVTKLGYSWEALDVKFWEGLGGLSTSLYDLSQTIEISDELTAQPHDCDSLLVQEYIPHDFELRIYTVEGKVEANIYTKFCSIKPNREFGDFQQLSSKEQAATEWMKGDSAALEDGERQCLELTNHWLAWLRTQACEVPPAIRFDYFVGRTTGQAGKATVWTLEICELGFSMLAHRQLPQKVFDAMLRSCLGERRGPSTTDDKEPEQKRLRAA